MGFKWQSQLDLVVGSLVLRVAFINCVTLSIQMSQRVQKFGILINSVFDRPRLFFLIIGVSVYAFALISVFLRLSVVLFMHIMFQKVILHKFDAKGIVKYVHCHILF